MSILLLAPLVIPLIGAGVAAGGAIYNAVNQNKTNEQSMDFQREMYDRQRQDALNDLADQRAYNNPSEQLRRLREAGLNPNLLYGNGTTATGISDQPRAAQATAPHLQAPRLDLNDALAKGIDLARNDAQIQLIKAQTANVNADTQNKQDTNPGITTRNEQAAFNLELAKVLRDNNINISDQELRALTEKASNIHADTENKYANLKLLNAATQKTIQDTRFSLSENDRRNITVTQNVAESRARISEIIARNLLHQQSLKNIKQDFNIKLDQELTEEARRNNMVMLTSQIQQSIENMVKQGEILDLEIMLKRMDIPAKAIRTILGK